MQWPLSGEVTPFASAATDLNRLCTRFQRSSDAIPSSGIESRFPSLCGRGLLGSIMLQIVLPSSLAGRQPGGFEEMFLVAKLNLKFGVVSRFRVYSW
jgi:hypothetical protein